MQTEELIVVMLGSLGILAGVVVIWMAMQSRRQIREMEHRERLAMIEHGLVPAPESDPAGFDRKFAAVRAPASPSASRARSGGVTMISLGLAFMFLLSFAAGAAWRRVRRRRRVRAGRRGVFRQFAPDEPSGSAAPAGRATAVIGN